jgi:hypothetical protein
MKKLFTILPGSAVSGISYFTPSFSSSYTWVSTEQLGSGAGILLTGWLPLLL